MSEGKNFQRIESAQNERLKIAVRLADSSQSLKKAGLAVAEGLHLAEHLLSQQDVQLETVWIPDSLLNKPEWVAMAAASPVLELGQVRCIVLPDTLYTKLSRVNSPTGPMIFFSPPQAPVALSLEQDVVLLDGIQDPGNAGTLLRNCAAAGVHQVVFSEHTAWLWSDKVLRAGMGAQFALSLYPEEDLLLALKHHHARVPVRVTSLQSGTRDLFDLDLRPAGVWVFGSEGQGVRPAWLDRATVPVRIPQSLQVESMNVGSSSAVCLFEQFRQRR